MHTWDILRSNLSQDRDILTGVSCGFPQPLQANAGTAPWLGYNHFHHIPPPSAIGVVLKVMTMIGSCMCYQQNETRCHMANSCITLLQSQTHVQSMCINTYPWSTATKWQWHNALPACSNWVPHKREQLCCKISLFSFVMSMVIPLWVPAVCNIGWNTSEMVTGTSPICLALVDQEPPWNTMNTELMCSIQMTKGRWLGKL